MPFTSQGAQVTQVRDGKWEVDPNAGVRLWLLMATLT